MSIVFLSTHACTHMLVFSETISRKMHSKLTTVVVSGRETEGLGHRSRKEIYFSLYTLWNFMPCAWITYSK